MRRFIVTGIGVLVVVGSAAAQSYIGEGGENFDTRPAVAATAATGNQADLVLPRNAIDGSGLDETGEMHTNESVYVGEHYWMGQTGDEGNKSGQIDTGGNWIKFEFDQVYAIDYARIWNYNGSGGARGMNQVVVEYSATGGVYPDEWSRLGGPDAVQEFERAPAESDYVGFNLPFGGAEARVVVFTAAGGDAGVANFGGTSNAGLSEVRFYLPGAACDPGDADRDGDVDDDDLSLLLANWGEETNCDHGEFSGVVPVNDDDLSLLLANWTGPRAGAVPEPATIALIVLGALALPRRKR